MRHAVRCTAALLCVLALAACRTPGPRDDDPLNPEVAAAARP